MHTTAHIISRSLSLSLSLSLSQTDRVGVVPAENMNDATMRQIQEAKMSGKKLDDENVVTGLRKEVNSTQEGALCVYVCVCVCMC